jgi:lysosomal acid lipase/cholesteryl ester hydrolase
MGNYDIPASLNYVRNVTGQDKLTYIGHSLGGALFFVAMTQHPELNSKIDVMIGMAPASTVANVQTYYTLIFRYFNLIQVRTAVKFSISY